MHVSKTVAWWKSSGVTGSEDMGVLKHMFT
jgi:hypothetical protein